MEQTASLFKLVYGNKDCEWIYRFWANSERPWGVKDDRFKELDREKLVEDARSIRR